MLNWLKKKLTPADDMTATLQSYSGSGTLHCHACGHSEAVLSFTHGFGPTSSCTTGYQCQSCAKFATFDSEPVGESGIKPLEEKVRNMKCECGGSYARDKPMMCSRCKSLDVGYELGMVT